MLASPTVRDRIRIGPAGWSYKDWDGIVYPKPRPRGFHPAAFLAQYFDTIELNSTFYRIPAAEMAKAWAAKTTDVNPRFLFTAKLHQAFTHQRNATAADERAMRAVLDALAGRGVLGAVLLQFPWSCRNTPENRDYIGRLLRSFAGYPNVVEVRHGSWNDPGFLAWLRERNAGICDLDQPLIGRSLGPSASVTSAVGYVRMHGRNYGEWFRSTKNREQARHASAQGKPAEPAAAEYFAPEEGSRRYDYLYSDRELTGWAPRIEQIASHSQVTFVIANNHFEGKAVVNGLQLSSMMLGRHPEPPATLLERYPQLAHLASSTKPDTFELRP
jgi:uncharacterized protein YecE (DUF72 family)